MTDDLARFLAEDVGEGDVTTDAILAAVGDRDVVGHVVAREPMVVAGLAEASAVFARNGAKVEARAKDGDRVEARAVLAVVSGPARAILTAERLALNFLMRMGGIATLTRRLQEEAARANPRCRVAATRKTTPGFRAYEKKAVALGGGDPHRERLDSAFLVKDNHLGLGVGIREAVERCRAHRPGLFVEVEADVLPQAEEAAKAGADAVLLDNMPVDVAREAARRVRLIKPDILVEVSGGILPTAVPLYAAFADRISMGRLTLGAPPVDVGLDFLPA